MLAFLEHDTRQVFVPIEDLWCCNLTSVWGRVSGGPPTAFWEWWIVLTWGNVRVHSHSFWMRQLGNKDRLQFCRGNWKYSQEQCRRCDSDATQGHRLRKAEEERRGPSYRRKGADGQARWGIRLPVLTALPGMALLPKLDSGCFSALEFCPEDHFPLSLTS